MLSEFFKRIRKEVVNHLVLILVNSYCLGIATGMLFDGSYILAPILMVINGAAIAASITSVIRLVSLIGKKTIRVLDEIP